MPSKAKKKAAKVSAQADSNLPIDTSPIEDCINKQTAIHGKLREHLASIKELQQKYDDRITKPKKSDNAAQRAGFLEGAEALKWQGIKTRAELSYTKHVETPLKIHEAWLKVQGKEAPHVLQRDEKLDEENWWSKLVPEQHVSRQQPSPVHQTSKSTFEQLVASLKDKEHTLSTGSHAERK
ncbi:MAG: hypothetical protein Q9181_004830 [Wetmoreana brouardii]